MHGATKLYQIYSVWKEGTWMYRSMCGKRRVFFFFGGGGLGRSISGLILHQNRIWCSASMAWVLGIGSSRGADSSVHTGTLVFKLFVKIILFCGVAMYCGRK